MTKNENGTETVDELAPGMTGRWLVTTEGSQHVWDLDHMTWARYPGPLALAGACVRDGEDLPIRQIDRYPKIGDVSVVLCDNPENPKLCHWRRSSWIERIERLDAAVEPAPRIKIFAHEGLVIANGSAALFAINQANSMTPGEACATAFRLDEQGEHDLAKQLWKAAAEADQQAEQPASSAEEDRSEQDAWGFLSGAVTATLLEALEQEGSTAPSDGTDTPPAGSWRSS